MKIDALMIPEGSPDYYDPSFRSTLEAHLAYLRTSNQTQSMTVLPHDTIVYNQDLFGFLNKSRVVPNLHWLVMRMNNFFSPYDFDENCTQLLIPSGKEIEVFRQSWKTVPVIST